MPLYFAYGANMDRDGMAARCPGAMPLGVASLKRHRFFIMREGYASVRRDPRAEVFGVLWELSLSHVRALDRFEELDRGLYVKLVQPVVLFAPALAEKPVPTFPGPAAVVSPALNEKPVPTFSGPARASKQALIYLATSAEPGRPRPGYLEDVIAAGESWDLPTAYLAAMRAILDPQARARAAATAPAQSRAASRASQSWRWGED